MMTEQLRKIHKKTIQTRKEDLLRHALLRRHCDAAAYPTPFAEAARSSPCANEELLMNAGPKGEGAKGCKMSARVSRWFSQPSCCQNAETRRS